MTPKINQYLNKTVLVSIPALFDDGQCREFTLRGVELHGLWLQSDDLAKRMLNKDMQAYASAGPVIFVPFAQIAGVLFATRAPTFRSGSDPADTKADLSRAAAEPIPAPADKAKVPPGRKLKTR